jgi:hypothetical protein
MQTINRTVVEDIISALYFFDNGAAANKRCATVLGCISKVLRFPDAIAVSEGRFHLAWGRDEQSRHLVFDGYEGTFTLVTSPLEGVEWRGDAAAPESISLVLAEGCKWPRLLGRVR